MAVVVGEAGARLCASLGDVDGIATGVRRDVAAELVVVRFDGVLVEASRHVLIEEAGSRDVEIGDFVKIESNCFIPTYTHIGSRVFLGPNVVLTNDKYPLRRRESYRPIGPVIEDNVSLGAGVVILPGVSIGAGSFVSAGAVVTKDVPPMTLVQGNPGTFLPLPDCLRENNTALSWRRYLSE